MMPGIQPIPFHEEEEARSAAFNGDILRLDTFLQRYGQHPKILENYAGAGVKSENSTLQNAQLIIANSHHFNLWEEYESFKTSLHDEGSALWQFEAAADAIVNGDATLLTNLLQQNPTLINMRSPRNHRATLLIYVGANGIEGYRQKTPANAVEIAKILLNAGAEVDARGLMYRGTTTLGLVATSVHPVVARVQEPLMQILFNHGADPNIAVGPDYTEGSLIIACLANGRSESGKFLARHGARVDLEAACGIGDLEKVKSYFNADGTFIDSNLNKKRDAGMIWACEYGYVKVVEYLLAHGTPVDTISGGMTPLHGAVLGAHLDIIDFLISKNAPLEIKNNYDCTVLGQAIWCGYNNPKPQALPVIEKLITAGAYIDSDWQPYIDDLRKRLMHGTI
jgi:ankyrin repeat protein